MSLNLTCAIALFVVGWNSVVAQTSENTQVDTFAIRALKWRNIGPFRAGRSVAVAGSVKRPLEYYAGTTGGGVIKTTNGGYTWEPVSDKFFGGTIGGIAVFEPNPDIVYVGTGELTLRGNTSHGDGVYKTTDGGAAWTFLGLRDTRHISKVIVHPWNADIVYVAALGHAFGPNPERGVFRTKDGGKTWEKVLFRSDSAGASDLVMDPTNPNVLYAATWQVLRKPWDIVSGGAGSAIYKTTDGGDHWTDISHNRGLPKGILGNVGLAVSPANPQIVWAMVEADSGGLFRSGDGGATWQVVNRRADIHWRPFYFSKVFADPADTNTVYLPNGTLYRSTDGGKHFASVRPYDDLWDTHVLWIAPNDPNRMIVGADQGARISVNKGANWSTVGYATGQFYHIVATNHFPYRVCGPQQDNSGACGPSRTDDMFDISAWYYPGGGESEAVAVDQNDPNVTYSPGERIDKGKGISSRLEQVWERTAPPSKAKYRWNWTTPVIVSPHDSRVLYVGSNVLFKSTDRGANWTEISGDLTRHDPRTLIVAGGPITKETTGAENYATIFAIAESPLARGLLWVGSDDGLIHVSRNGGATWKNVTPSGFPEFTRVSMIEPSPHAAGTAYVAANRNMLDDLTPYIYKTTDFGATWTRIVNGIPADEFVRAVRADPVQKGLLFAGTERSVWFSLDDGDHWQSLRRNLPLVPVHDLVVKEGDLAIATHGRAFWIMDDISPLRQLAAGTAVAGTSRLLQPRDAYRVFWHGGQLIQNLQTGTNPPDGAMLYYSLPDSGREVTLDILDAQGAVVNSLTSRPDPSAVADSLRREEKKRIRNDSLRTAGVTDSARLAAPYVEPPTGEPQNRLAPAPHLSNDRGLNMFAWSFRHADGPAVTDSAFQLQRPAGPYAVPGTYTIRLASGGQTSTAKLTLKADPRITATAGDLAARERFSRDVNVVVGRVIETVNGLGDLRRQVDDRRKSTTAAAAAGEELRVLRDSLWLVARRLAPAFEPEREPEPFATNILDELWGFRFGDMNTAPSRVERSGFATASEDADRELAEARAVVASLVPAVNTKLAAGGASPVVIPAVFSAPRGVSATERLPARR